MTETSSKSVVIIGAGVSGLCAAYMLKKRGVNVTVLEKDSEPGGTMKTLHNGGWLIEAGPNSALETTPLFQQLFDELEITNRRLYASEEASNRYIVRKGKLHALPMSPSAFLKSRLWSWNGKIRLLKEPFVGRAKREETVAEFVRRRLGNEFLDYAINPFVAGVYAGNPEQLSVQTAFPKLYALEEKYGGLMKGMVLGRKDRKQRAEKAKDRARLFSFTGGLEVFPKAIAERLGNSVKLDSAVDRIIPVRAGRFPVYTVSYKHDNIQFTTEANAVVLATPAYGAAAIVRPIDPAMAATLESIYYPPVVEVFLGFRQEDIKRPLDGFGFLVPEVERRKTLGTIWSSALFPNRAPAGTTALTTFVGGARQPELTTSSDEQIMDIVLSELRSIMEIDGSPVYSKIIRWERAIPQYNLGYYKILKAIEQFEQNFQGTFVCSNYRGGIAVGDCVMSADKLTERVLQYLHI